MIDPSFLFQRLAGYCPQYMRGVFAGLVTTAPRLRLSKVYRPSGCVQCGGVAVLSHASVSTDLDDAMRPGFSEVSRSSAGDGGPSVDSPALQVTFPARAPTVFQAIEGYLFQSLELKVFWYCQLQTDLCSRSQESAIGMGPSYIIR